MSGQWDRVTLSVEEVNCLTGMFLQELPVNLSIMEKAVKFLIY